MAAADAAWPAWAALAPVERGRALAAYAALVDAEQAAARRPGAPRDGQAPGRGPGRGRPRGRGRSTTSPPRPSGSGRSSCPAPTLATGSWVRPAPLGVVAAITPWNFPVALVVWKLAPALAAGCAVVVKPADRGAPGRLGALRPRRARRAARRAWSAASPATGRCWARPWPPTRAVAKVAFTGSRRVAEQIAAWAAPRLKALSLELGGHGALVVLPDADLDVAAEVAVVQGYVNSGQACYAVNRVLVPPGPRRRPARAHARAHRRPRARPDGHRARPGAPPHAARRRPRRTARGSRAARRSRPARLAPALVTGAGPGVRLVDEEPFTPIVAVMEVPDAAAAIAEANRPDYGLVGYVCGRRPARRRSRPPRRSSAGRS